MVKRVDNAVYDIVKDVVNHNFQGGFHVFGLDTAGVGYVIDDNNKNLVSQETIQKAEEAKQKIIGGLPLARFYPELKNCMLLCATEMSKRQDMDAVAAAFEDH